MPEAGIYILAALGVGLVLVRPLKLAFAALVAYWAFIPASLIVPGGPHILLVDRLVLYAFALRLVVGARRQRRVAPGTEPTAAPVSAFRLTRLHVAMVGVLAAGFLDGVVLAAHGASLASDLDSWLYTLDMAVVFVVVLAVVRALGHWTVIRTVVVALGATVVFAVLERLTGSGWSHFLFEHMPGQYLGPGADPLGVRAGHVRAQVGGAILYRVRLGAGHVPAPRPGGIVAVGTTRRGGREAFGAMATRRLPLSRGHGGRRGPHRLAQCRGRRGGRGDTPRPGDGRARRLTTVVAAGLLVVVLVALVDGSLIGSPFNAAAHTDSVTIRLQRLPSLFALVVHRPFTGLGYSGLYGSLPGLDDAYALLYGTIGVVGLAAWGVMLLTTAVSVTRALRARIGSDTRDLGAACLVGIVAVVVAGAAYDLVATPQSQWAFMILAAVGAGIAEAVPRRVPARRWWAARALLPAAGIAGGLLVLAGAPTASAQTTAVFTASPAVIAASGQPVDDYTGKVLGNTLCAFLTDPGELLANTTLSCSRPVDVSPGLWPMLDVVRITGPDPAAVRAEYAHSLGRIGSVLPAEITPVGTIETGKPAWATTAPLWMGLVGLAAMFLVPPLTRRPWRPRRDESEPPPGTPGGMNPFELDRLYEAPSAARSGTATPAARDAPDLAGVSDAPRDAGRSDAGRSDAGPHSNAGRGDAGPRRDEVPVHYGQSPRPPGTDERSRPPDPFGQGPELVSLPQLPIHRAGAVVPNQTAQHLPAGARTEGLRAPPLSGPVGVEVGTENRT